MKLIYKILFNLLLVVISLPNLQAQDTPKKEVKRLLTDAQLQMEVTSAVNNMYNAKHHIASVEFNALKIRYGWHPLPYFLLGLNEWWKIVPNDVVTIYDKKLIAYMDTTIYKARQLEKLDPGNEEASFFLAAAYGFKGRLLAERKGWRKAATAGKSALKYLDIGKQKDSNNIELLFGDALYNYYSVWIPENYPLLKPILIFFKKGDKALGLKQLRQVANNAFYTRTEAQYFLMRILATEENEIAQALQISEYLHQTFPDNAYFHRYYARMLYTSGQYVKCRRVSLSLLEKIDKGYVGYEATGGRYAGFFLGQIYQSFNKLDDAKKYYKKAVTFSESIGATKSGYYLHSLLNIGTIERKQGNKKEAKKYYKLVKKQAKPKHATHKRAKKYLKEMRKGK